MSTAEPQIPRRAPPAKGKSIGRSAAVSEATNETVVGLLASLGRYVSQHCTLDSEANMAPGTHHFLQH